MEGAEGKIKADGTTLGPSREKFVVCTLVGRRRAAPSKKRRGAAPCRNVSIRAAFRGTTRSFVVLFGLTAYIDADEQG